MDETGAHKANSEDDGWGYAAIGCVAIAAIVLLLLFVSVSQSKSEIDGTVLGPVGDWFGGILNPLIGLLALVGLIKTVTIQGQTLKSTRESVEIQIRSQAKQQSFQTFFDLLNLRAGAVESVEWLDPEYHSGRRTLKGRAAIKAILKTIEGAALLLEPADIEDELTRWEVPKNVPLEARSHIALFAAFYSGHPVSFAAAFAQNTLQEEGQLRNIEAEVGHVFRATYQVLKFIYHDKNVSVEEKNDMVNYLRAQMSEAEFALFALTALTLIGEKSRAVAIAFNFYQNRLYPIPWARALVALFDPSDSENLDFASTFGYAPL